MKLANKKGRLIEVPTVLLLDAQANVLSIGEMACSSVGRELGEQTTVMPVAHGKIVSYEYAETLLRGLISGNFPKLRLFDIRFASHALPREQDYDDLIRVGQ
jgi:actin-like ATPase involved in cell morphogenesis